MPAQIMRNQKLFRGNCSILTRKLLFFQFRCCEILACIYKVDRSILEYNLWPRKVSHGNKGWWQMECPPWYGAEWISLSIQPFKSLPCWWSSSRYAKRCNSSTVFTLWRNELILFCVVLLDEHWRDIVIYSHWYRWKLAVCHSWT